MIGVVERFVETNGLSPALSRAIVGSQALTNLAAKAHRKPDRFEKKKFPYRSSVLLRAAERFAGPNDAWLSAVARDLATQPNETQKAWRKAIATWEEQALPYPVRAAWKRYEKILASLAPDGGPAQARKWLGMLVESPATSGGARDRLQARLRFVEGLIVIVMREPNNDGRLGRSLLERALVSNNGGGVASPRLAYRSIDLLAAVRDVDALRTVATDSPYPRVRAYAELRAKMGGGAERPSGDFTTDSRRS